eukprot:CAMPEP_0170526458 /NCGR_PEP_ID=MMETSP0209-20121228/11860_1 /TAXON_ID=665100 ORGANISM="Litonotus pictus, Strain P1" /NCGR_SAMPLE_ID=MMETSP0209 /ASSEMBLY_ACC=CAM_ASM_000301 /LENGTH=1549 /DNA_ID=CAMNT_0010816271 /DNA_START=14 /DNA_END=4660 /DNA_ORIENTATION=-
MNKKTKQVTKKKVQTEYENSEDEEFEENDEDENQYEDDGFIVQDNEVSDDEGDDSEEDEDSEEYNQGELDESDYSILDDQYKHKKSKHKKKKLKKGGEDINDIDDFEDIDKNISNTKNSKIKLEKNHNYYETKNEDNEIQEEVPRRDYPKKKFRQRAPDNLLSKDPTLNKIFNLNEDAYDREPDNEEDQEMTHKEKIKKLTKYYAKEEIEEQFITERDSLIKQLDFPERSLSSFSESDLRILSNQIKEEETENLIYTSPDMISAEVEFIYEKLKYSKTSSSGTMENTSLMREKIKVILEHMKVKHMEVPFIVTYRKFVYEPELNTNDVWKICIYDLEWKKIYSYKESLRKQLKQLKFLEMENLSHLEKKYIDKPRNIHELKCMESFVIYYKDNYSEEIAKSKKLKSLNLNNSPNSKNIKTEDNQLDDVKVNSDNEEEQKVTFKRPVKQFVIPKASKLNSINIGRKFTISPYNFSLNIDLLRSGSQDFSKLILPQDPDLDPNDLSNQFVDEYFKNNFDLMKSSCSLVAEELLVYPSVRLYIFNVLKSYAKISTHPTEQGIRDLDVFHPSFRVKRLKSKPIHSFNNDIFLDILRCEKDGLITFSIDIDSEDIRNLTDKLFKCYRRNSNSDLTKKWNVIREEIIKTLMKQVVPSFKKEIVTHLIENAENSIIDQAALNFRELLMTGPFKKTPNQKLIYFEDSPRVLSFVYDHEKNVVFSVMLDEYGEVKDIQPYYFLSSPLENQPRNDFNKDLNQSALISSVNISNNEFYNESNGESEFTKMKNLMEKYSPELIVIAANHIKTKQIKENLTQIANDILTSNRVTVTFGDITIPYIFATSNTLEMKYNQFNLTARQAISLGRFKQNPLAEILQLWHEEQNSNRCMSLSLHPLQKNVNQNKLFERLEIEAIRVVNQLGVDLNRVKSHSHLKKQLYFVAGLGPRKANYLLEKVNMFGELINRNDAKLILGDKVIINMIGFIKVKHYTILSVFQQNAGYSESNNIITSNDIYVNANLLDMTRIHPEYYSFAKNMVKSAIEDDKLKDNEKIEKVLLNPEILLELETNETIKKQEELGNFSFKTILEQIMTELNDPFKDSRKPHRELGDLEIFKLMTAEYPLDVGFIVLAKSMKIGKNQVFCKLENDLEASLSKNDIFDDNFQPEIVDEKMNQMYPRNCLFYARIKSINKATFRLELTTKPSKLISHKNEVMLGKLDDYFIVDEEQDFRNNIINEEKAQDSKKLYTKRNINHPNFKNLNFVQCLEYLKNRDIGDYIFRPSSKSSNYLTLSWNFYKNVISHITIVEEEKAKGANIGAKLRISGEVYSSLHEIADRFVSPCKRIVQEATMNRKFSFFETVEAMEKKLREDKNKDPILIHYLFTINPAYPQYILIAYIPKINQVIKEFMKVKARGLYFHNNYYNDLNDVAKYFKDNYSKEDYRSYVRRIKPPGEEQILDSSNNYGSSFVSYNNMNSSGLVSRNDVNSASYLGSKRTKSPSGYNQPGSYSFNAGSHYNNINSSYASDSMRNSAKRYDNTNLNNWNSGNTTLNNSSLLNNTAE